VTHPAIEREKAQAATPQQSGGAPSNSTLPPNQKSGEPAPVAATKVSTAKTSNDTKGFRVTNGTKKGTVIGHEGELSTVKWDDGTTTAEPGTAFNDLREVSVGDLRQLVREALMDQRAADAFMERYKYSVDGPLMASRREFNNLAPQYENIEQETLRWFRTLWDAVNGDLAQTTEGKEKLRTLIAEIQRKFDWISAHWGSDTPIANARRNLKPFLDEVQALVDTPIGRSKQVEPELTPAQKRAAIAAKFRRP
jgi:hypothetical protein